MKTEGSAPKKLPLRNINFNFSFPHSRKISPNVHLSNRCVSEHYNQPSTFRADVTRDDPQRRFLVQQSVVTSKRWVTLKSLLRIVRCNITFTSQSNPSLTSVRICLVPRPHYSARPMRFGSRGLKWTELEGLRRRRTGTRRGELLENSTSHV